ncbi:MAG TPA: tetratricopeptide repeat protein [Bryobacteraceae bacterium]|nr:tetratricopeptide repeat protein [Bryobacteraceae bacterium]
MCHRMIGIALALALCAAGQGNDWRQLCLDGIASEKAGRYAEAESTLKQALAAARAIDPRGPETATVLNGVGTLLHQLGRWMDSEKAYLESLSILEHRTGPESAASRTARINLLAFYTDTNQPGKGDEIADALQKSLAPGSSGSDDAAVHGALASFRLTTSEWDRAESHFQESVRIWSLQKRAPEGIHYTLSNYGLLLFQRGRIQEAKDKFLRARDTAESQLGRGHPYFHRTLANLGIAYGALGETKQADKLLALAVDLAIGTFGPDHIHTAQIMNSYLALPRRKHDRVSREMTRQAQAIVEKHSRENPINKVWDVRTLVRR